MTPAMWPDRARENSRTTDLLAAELPDARFDSREYLDWLYDTSPYGPAIERSGDDDTRRVAHYAMIPQRYRGVEGPVAAGFSLHAVVRSDAQRQGWFRRLGREVCDAASAEGWQFATGVCNARSIGTAVKYLGWNSPGPLPVRICPSTAFVRAGGAPDGVESFDVTADLLDSAWFARLAATLDDAPTQGGWTNDYSPTYLRWRLARPRGGYALHISDDLVGLSARDVRMGVPAAIVLKLLPRSSPTRRHSAAPIVRAACRHHRAPYAVYAGFNAHVGVAGFSAPRRLQPSPLHLILRSLNPAVDQQSLRLDTFEFLDMDAY
jgi:hypothetical protein